ncbi:MAG: cbb3-type cytochrome c oxidase subunit I, partial [Acidimicrobiia bacterium]|nr:cbb3-type cytochrome c oxidase subunit I [Acidimicrobiia bacterium]
TGRMLNETMGKWHFWIMMIGFNLTFAPMHLLGLNGMPRRIYTYPEGLGFEFWNFIATLGAFTIAISVLLFIVNLVWSKRRGEVAGPDPWDGRTLEWSIPSPPPVHNFDEVPVVRSVDDFWHRKYTEDDEGRLVPMPPVSGGALAVDEKATGGDDDHHGEIHMPSPSYYPALTAVGMTTATFGLTYTPWGWIAVGIGGVITLLGLFGWAVEPVTKEDH